MLKSFGETPLAFDVAMLGGVIIDENNYHSCNHDIILRSLCDVAGTFALSTSPKHYMDGG